MCEKCGSDCLCGWISKDHAKLIKSMVDKEYRSDCANLVVRLSLLTDLDGRRLVSDKDINCFRV